MSTIATLDATRLRTFRQTAEECPAFKLNYLRYLYANRHTNGFIQCVVKIGGRTFIDLDALSAWAQERNSFERKISAPE